MLDHWNASHRRELMDSHCSGEYGRCTSTIRLESLLLLETACIHSVLHALAISHSIDQHSFIIRLIRHSILERLWDAHCELAWFLAFFSRQTCMHAFILFNDGSLTRALMTNDGEYDGDTRLLVSEILEYLAAMRAWPFFLFCGICHGSDPMS